MKVGLSKLENSLEMSEEYDLHIRDKRSGEDLGTIGGKRPYTKFGKFLFKSWDWVEKLDVDRFIILHYPNQEEKEKAAKAYFGDSKASVCDSLDYDFTRVDI